MQRAKAKLELRPQGTCGSGAIHWTPCVCSNATTLMTSDRCTVTMHEEGMGTSGAIRWAPCGRDYIV